MKTDSQLQQDVMAELRWEPGLDEAEIGVTVSDGVVTLSGFAKSYAEKMTAESAARRVAGVRAIAEEIKVRWPTEPQTQDVEVAKRILESFRWDVSVPEDEISVKVEHGWVTLSGAVDWNYQREAAQLAAGRINGVIGLNNQITIRQAPLADDVRDRIMAAIKRSAELEASRLIVTTEGDKVVLSGRVKAWSEREIAERAAWSAPGVTRVEDNIIVAT